MYGFNMNAIRSVAIKEPLVDVVDRRQVVTSNGMLKEVDLYTATVDELSFRTPFSLRIKQDDYVQAFVAFFSVEFLKCHTKTMFTTCKSLSPVPEHCSCCGSVPELVSCFIHFVPLPAPDHAYTHWKHTVFYIDDAITVSQGALLNGFFTCRPNTNNKVISPSPYPRLSFQFPFHRSIGIRSAIWTLRSKWTTGENMRTSLKSSRTRCADATGQYWSLILILIPMSLRFPNHTPLQKTAYPAKI